MDSLVYAAIIMRSGLIADREPTGRFNEPVQIGRGRIAAIVRSKSMRVSVYKSVYSLQSNGRRIANKWQTKVLFRPRPRTLLNASQTASIQMA